MPTHLQDGETILFTGDSITDCGRRNPPNDPYGTGYVSKFRDLLIVREPEKAVKIVNTGIGGDTVAGLRDRWIDDVIEHQPKWLSVKIGINDCHRFLGDPQANAVHSPERFAQNYDAVLAATLDLLPDVQVLLIDPFYASADLEGALGETHRGRVPALLAEYTAAVDELGATYNARRVKTQALFDRQFEHQPRSLYFPNEPVHPNSAGHQLIAEEVYRVLSQ